MNVGVNNQGVHFLGIFPIILYFIELHLEFFAIGLFCLPPERMSWKGFIEAA